MVMHSLVFKNASFKIYRRWKRLKRWIPSCDQQRSGDSEEAGAVWIYQKCFPTGRRSLRKDSEVSSFLMVEVTGHQDRPYRSLLRKKKKKKRCKSTSLRGFFKQVSELLSFVYFYSE